MSARSSLTKHQREQLVELFEQGFVYTAFVTDAFPRHIVGWALSDSMRTGALPLQALNQTIACAKEMPGLIHHLNHGSQYTSIVYIERLSEHKIVASTGTVGKPAALTEEGKLRRRVEQLEAENAYLENAGLEEPAARLKAAAIAILTSDHTLDDLLKAAGCARSTYFYHQARLSQPDEHAELKETIKSIFEKMKRRYGYRRVLSELRNQGWQVGHKLVYKLMDHMGLKSKVRTRRKYNSYKGHISHIADNILDRNFTPGKSNTAWVSDVTEFRVAGTKFYLPPVMDLHDRTILAYELSTSLSTKFTSSSLKNAIIVHQPAQGLIVHTDQGFQYQHSSRRRLIESVEGIQSMSRKGNCYDNAVMENFFGHLKTEMYHDEHFASVGEFRQAVDDYIFW
ncbi:transposase for insertion sequence [Corynebacterium deserti GIMN1.010]|uniref:Transposase for insertion sequence n=1 Tax=Corynebacterium deserti GIMN1.010 TaxID=931089 RepID=A0A0M4CXE0_9CORY|nr:transposase for insertion sequence [Corynebacterium deserti GIMN1.010]